MNFEGQLQKWRQFVPTVQSSPDTVSGSMYESMSEPFQCVKLNAARTWTLARVRQTTIIRWIFLKILVYYSKTTRFEKISLKVWIFRTLEVLICILQIDSLPRDTFSNSRQAKKVTKEQSSVNWKILYTKGNIPYYNGTMYKSVMFDVRYYISRAIFSYVL